MKNKILPIHKWVDTLSKQDKPRTVFITTGASGVGDMINFTPTLRAYKEAHPEHEIAVIPCEFTVPVLKNNPHVDYILPSNSIQYFFREGDTKIELSWSHFDQHQYGHVCKSYAHYVLGKTNIDLTQEMFVSQHDMDFINTLMFSLLQDNKEFVAISPTFTHRHRQVSAEGWQKIVDLLAQKYTVLSLGTKVDFHLNNVIDLRGQVRLHQIPYLLGFCKEIYVVQTGLLHAAGCNDKVKIVNVSAGEYPSEMHVPYRRGKLGWNCDVIEHSCPMKSECFRKHIVDSEFKKVYNQLKLQHGGKYSEDAIKKYAVWYWCISDDKFKCCEDVVENTLQYIRERL